jgi:hypothetical protein
MSAVRTILPLEPHARPLEAVSGAPSEALTADDALTRLRAAGLACDQARGPRLHILGGLRVVVSRGIHVYEDAFAILAEVDGVYLAMVADTGEHQEVDVSTESLAQAVETILSVYRERGVLRPIER